MNDNYYALIMAGGGGTRLWPVSRRSHPKQMMRLIDSESLFQIAVRRLDPLFPPERILVVTVVDQADELQRQCPEIPAENFVLEPGPRGTASAIGLGAVTIGKKDPAAVLAVLTADHIIQNEKRFLDLLRTAHEVALDEYLVTLGITPTFPSTGYGYIHYGASLGKRDGIEVFQVAAFKEKPDESTAKQFISDGDYAWNSGMFIMEVSTFLMEAARQMPDLYAGLELVQAAIGTPEDARVRNEIWENLTPQTIDYGIMEGAGRVAIIPGEGLGWNDVGSWESLFETLPLDENGNIFINSESLSLDTTNTLVFDDTQKRLIVMVGIDDLVIVETDDVMLICKKEQSQRVREIVDLLKRSGREEIL